MDDGRFRGIEGDHHMAKRDDMDWRQHVLNNVLPRMEANDMGAATGFTPATPGDFGPITFRGDRTPDDAAALLPDAAATKFIAIGQTASDLHGAIPTHEQVSQVRLEATGCKNRINDLTRHKSEGGFGLDAAAPQVQSERRKLDRAEKELARLTELKETRTVRWTARRAVASSRQRLGFARHSGELCDRTCLGCAVIGIVEEGRDHKRRG
jgi:hypothetical protein